MLWKRQTIKQGKNRKTYTTSSVITTKFLSQDIDAGNTWHYTTFLQRSYRDQNLNVLVFAFFILHGEFGEKDIALSDNKLPSQHKQIYIPFILLLQEQTNPYHLFPLHINFCTSLIVNTTIAKQFNILF